MRFLSRALLGLAITAAAGPLSAAEADKTDAVRVLIDVSGSMKETDPGNLRTPALRLLVNLLPPDSEAGVWHFAQQVNRVTPVANADARWRRGALDAADQIHSRGLFTDIGAALSDATADWQAPSLSERRSIILLTDGKVDVSKEPGANEAARSQLVQDLLPQLQKLGVQVHTIALSDDADKALMERLALGTDGEFFQVANADELRRIFLRLFEKTVERETVPLEGNRFQVDGKISEMTVLAFRAQDAAPTRLTPPSGATFGRTDAPKGVRWFHERGYDLITVDDPAPGDWLLVADVDPDNRVMIVTDLELRTTRLPSNLIVGERLQFAAGLSEKGKLITRPDFLSVVEFTVTQRPEADNRGPRWVLQDNGVGEDKTSGDGLYTIQLGESLAEGKHVILTRAESATFERQDRQRVTVHAEPLSIREVDEAEGKQLLIQPAVDWLDPATLQISAAVSRADGTSREEQVSPDDQGTYALALPETARNIPVKVTLTLAGQTTSGRQFTATLPARTVLPLADSSTDETEGGTDGPAPARKAANWGFIGAVVAAVNLGILGLLGIGYLIWTSRRSRDEPAVEGEDEGDDQEPARE